MSTEVCASLWKSVERTAIHLPVNFTTFLICTPNVSVPDSNLLILNRVDGVQAVMFNTLFSKNSAKSAAEPAYIEVSGLMDDFMSLEEIAPGAEWSDVLAATWGVPSAPNAVEVRSAVRSKSVLKSIRSFVQSFRSGLEIA